MPDLKKIKLLFIFSVCICFLNAQNSPFFYKRAVPDRGIESDEHARNVKRFNFKAENDDQKNVLKKNKYGEGTEFNGEGPILFNAYFEHSLYYYYTQNLQNPKKEKKDWDFSETFKLEDNSPWNGITAKTIPVGFMVFIIKVDGKEAASFIGLMPKNDFGLRTSFIGKLWNVSMNKMKEGETYMTWENGKNVVKTVSKETPAEKYSKMIAEKSFYPLFYYMRDHGKAGSNKIEIEIYPAVVDCKKTSDRSEEIICKGEFTLTLTAKDVKDMKEAGGPAYSPDTRVYCGSGFTYVK